MPKCLDCGEYTKYHKYYCIACIEKRKQTGTLPPSKKEEKAKKRSTPSAIKLYEALKKAGIPAELEKWDHHKHIDIAIPYLKVNIEIDGPQHNLDHKQALADLKRTYYSFLKQYVTLRIPNALVQKDFEKTIDYIIKLLKASADQLEQDEELEG